MGTNLRRGWGRLCVGLSLLFAVYALFVYPLMQQARSERIEKAELLNCWNESNAPDFKLDPITRSSRRASCSGSGQHPPRPSCRRHERSTWHLVDFLVRPGLSF